ncbi:hypothetical protein Glove_714g13 [Diversispora epigaea]|uniref:Uncharacterized protein n=1 Tax=Diversispora epigaea TaxID=1348612 RepID=A0A397G135_9GLOM|nr:hypothetical protein Glove_714g13 [Diversispora epigaea]
MVQIMQLENDFDKWKITKCKIKEWKSNIKEIGLALYIQLIFASINEDFLNQVKTRGFVIGNSRAIDFMDYSRSEAHKYIMNIPKQAMLSYGIGA